MKSNTDDLDDTMLIALLAWRNNKGRTWKANLLDAWMNGGDENGPHGASLRRIHNRFGPSWLVDLRPRDLETAAAAREITTLRN